MRTMSMRFAVAMVVLGVTLLCAATADLDSRLTMELDRLEQAQTALEAATLPALVRDAVAPNRAALDAARAASDPLLRLYRMRNAFVGIESLTFVAEHPEGGADLGELQKLWEQGPPSLRASAARRSLLQAALIQSAASRAQALYHVSLPYGKADGPVRGLQALGEARANVAFASFVASLPSTGETETAPAASAVSAAADALEAEMVALFNREPASRVAVVVSSRLMESRELLDKGSVAAATMLLLEARRDLSRAAPPSSTEPADAVDAPGDSMSRLWSAFGDDAIVRRDVLPLYAAIRGRR